MLDFQEQPLRVVLSAIAEAGGLNVTLSNIPQKNVTVRMGEAMSRDSMGMIIRGLAEANALKVTQIGPLMSIEGTAPTQEESAAQQRAALAQQFQQANQAAAVKLFTYRLKHANAVELAPVLTNLFTGAGGFGFATGPGGIQFVNPNTGAIGNIQVNPNGGFQINQGRGAIQGAAPNVNNNNGRGGFGNNGAANPVNPQVNPLAAALGAANAQQNAPGALSGQSGQIRIVAEASSNSLLVRATDTDWALIQQIIGGIDLRPLQVLIEVTIAEVTRTHDLDVGVSGGIDRKKARGTDSVGIGSSSSSVSDFVLALTGGHGAIDYHVALSALQTRGNVRVLSLPVIIAQNNQQAVLNVGQSVPFVQVSQSVVTTTAGVVQTVQYQDVGTTLTITPTINADGYVNMNVSQTDNSATNNIQFDAPIISKREATTKIFIRDGQTTVIGGLAGDTRNHTTQGIPFLSSIPLVGPLLFGHVTQNDETTELFLFLTPHIISSDQDIDQLRDAVKNRSDLLKTIPVGPNIVPAKDTIHVPLDSLRRIDSVKRVDSVRRADSLRTLRRRPPEPDSASAPMTLSSATKVPAGGPTESPEPPQRLALLLRRQAGIRAGIWRLT